MGLPAYYGVITASILGYFASCLICLVRLKVHFKVRYEATVKNFIDILCGSMIMAFLLFVLRMILPSDFSRLGAFFYLICYVFIGAGCYFLVMYWMKSIQRIFGGKVFQFLKKKVTK